MKKKYLGVPYIIWMLIFILSPLILIVVYALMETTDTGKIIFTWLAYPAAMILARLKTSKAGLISLLFVLPMWMNFLMRTYAWRALLDMNGPINQLLTWIGVGPQQLLYTEGAVVFGLVYNFLPFMLLPIYSVFVKLDPSYEQAAQDLGANKLQVLTKVTIPGSVTSIEESAFQSCTGLTEIVLPESVTSIGKDAFWNCSGLTDITLPEGLVSIGPEAFAYCTSLTDITLPGSVRRIGSGAFARCEALTGIALPEGITAIEVYTFQRCEALTEIVLPESLTSIKGYAFSGCTGLTEIVIPGGVASIEENSFYLCSDLTDVYYGATAEDWAALGDHRFADYIHYSCTDREGHWYQESAQPTCTEAGYDREACACGYIRNEQTTPTTGHSHAPVITAPTCTEPGYTTYTCSACGDSYEADDVAPLGHDMGPWTPIDEELERRECSRCDFTQTRRIGGNILVLTDEELMAQDTLWVDGQPVPVQGEGDERYVELPTGAETTLVSYSWHIGDGADVHTQYPTGMKVYRIEGDELGYTAEYVPELDDLLRYSGSSIRITGNKGIRMITAITQANKNALTGEGLAGYTLEEYGTALCWATDLAPGEDLVLGKAYTRSNYAYKKDVADPVFAYSGDVMKYTNVLVGFDNEQCAPDIAMRPYIILSDGEGDLVTLYGGTVYRSIGYIAWQNRLDFSPGTASYAFIWDIIHHVYGDIYDTDYQG